MAVQAIIHEGWRTILARVVARDLPDTYQDIVLFKIGEGGSSGGIPIAPDATFTDLQSEGAPLAGGGTCEFTNGSVVVTGSGTSFLADVSPGDWIKPGPTPSSDYASAGTPGSEEDGWGQVLSVNSNISITLVAAYVGATHLLAELRPCHLDANAPLFTFRKTLVAGDVLFNSAVPAVDEITAIVASGEANANQLAANPGFYEMGLFDALGVMVLYVTFDLQTKSSGVQLNTIIQIVY